MANTVVSNITTYSATGQITGLDNAFNTSYYMSAGIAMVSCSFGQSTQPGGTYGSVSAPSSRSLKSTPTFSLNGFYAGETFTVYGWARAANGLYYPAGETAVTTYPATPTDVNVGFIGTTQLGLYWTNSGGRTSIKVSLNDGAAETLSSMATLKTWTGLSPSTSYTLKVWYVYNGLEGEKVSKIGTTLANQVAPSAPTSLTKTSDAHRGFTLSSNWPAGTEYLTFKVVSNSTSVEWSNNESTTSSSFTTLYWGSSFNCYVKASNTYGSSSWYGPITFYTAPRAALNIVQSVSGTSVTIYTGLAESVYTQPELGSWDYAYIELCNTGWNVIKSEYKYPPNGEVTFTGLSLNTTYNVRAKVYYQGVGCLGYANSVFTTLATSRPSNWSWARTYTQGGNIGSVSISNSTGTINVITSTDWNNFVARVNAFRIYKNLPAISPSWYPVSSGGVFYLSQINDMRTAISAMSPPTPVPSQPTVVTASIFNGLRDSLNSIV